jgi:ribonuclease VapC
LILDSSAVLAILRREWNCRRLEAAMSGAETLSIGAPTLFEATMVAISRFGQGGEALVERFVDDWGVEVTPFDAAHCGVAIGAFVRYGKGRRHPAKLNFGDCMTYATARLAGAPLLFTGEDFAATDLVPALD